MHTPADVLSFWFGEPASTMDAMKAKLRKWFAGGPEMDATIRREFGAEVEAAVSGELDAWLTEPKGWLALLIVLDQFTRNTFRGDARTHAGDARAQKLALAALADGSLRALPLEERHFALMPLLHAEDAELQRRFAEEIALVSAAAPEALRAFYGGGVEQSQKYGEIIRRFGRFPHRNALLGRTSTPEEEAFLIEWEKRAPPAVARDVVKG